MQKWRGVVLQWWSLFVLGAIFILTIIIITFIAIWKIPEAAVSYRGLSQLDAAKIEDDYRKTLAQSIGTVAQIIGGFALLVGLFFTWRTVRTGQQNVLVAQENLRVAHEGQITERFTKAIEQLGDDKLEIRLGGIYALERIAKDSERDHWTIMEVLSAYIRQRARWQRGGALKENQPELTPPVDIQAILTVLGQRERTYGKGESEHLYLNRVNIKGALLRGAHLEGAFLRGAHLNGAHLEGARLTFARDLTQEQVDVAFGDERTKLPAGLQIPEHWKPKTE